MKNNVKKILLLTGVLCLASVGGVSAYLTDYDKVSNQFTVGKVDVELTEDNWKPDDHKKIEPGKVISKDPRIKNTGINDAYAYLEVSIPTANVIAAADNGSRLEKRVQELGFASDFIHVKKGMSRINVKMKSDEETEINSQLDKTEFTEGWK